MQADLAWLENPQVFRVGRLDAHSDHHFFETESDMRRDRETLRQSLNGNWKFHWSRNPQERPADFYREDAKLDGFGEIQVPGHMELQGYGQIHYTNTVYPWDGHAYLRPPKVDWEYNPVGSYVKEFDLNAGLIGKRVCVSFQGAEEAIYVWLNGVFLGYAEDSFTPSEFDLTPVIREKGNRLCVEVYKRSSAAWIEDQDFFRFSGLFREVFLYAKPKCHVEDLWAKPVVTAICDVNEAKADTAGTDTADLRGIGELELEVKLSGEACGGISWELLDESGVRVQSGQLKMQDGRQVTSELPKGTDAAESVELPVKMYGSGQAESSEETNALTFWRTDSVPVGEVLLWDLGKPHLYQLTLRVLDRAGEVTEVVPYKIGFRRFEIRGRVMLLNGKRLQIHGVNRHEWDAHRGRAVTEEDMRRDIEIFKKNHINAVRTCHYPNQSLWYQLCDEAGICMMDETNLESHGSWQKMGQCDLSWHVPGSLPEWKDCVLDRAASMLERDKNHAAILWWSCGNESYAGECIQAMSRYFHEKDPSRLVHYEGVFWNREYDAASDVESRMYAPPAAIRDYLEHDPEKPFLLCEYMHDMGCSCGGMESYQKLSEEFPMFQGGFIWDYIDQALWYQNQRGETVLGYGGDFGDRPTDYEFSGDGIVFADRTEKPAVQEIRFWYASEEEERLHKEENERRLQEAAARIRTGRAMAAGSGTAGNSGQMAETSREQLIQVIHGDVMLGVKGDGFEALFSLKDGGPVSLKYQGEEYLYRAPRPAFWRAATDNDKGNGFAAKSAAWLAADAYSVCTGCRVTEYEGDKETVLRAEDTADRAPAPRQIDRVRIAYTFAASAASGAEAEIVYTVDRRGRIRVELHYKGAQGLPQLPLFGVRFCLPRYYEKMTWEGLSGETYPDRMAGGVFGVHEAQVRTVPYLVPQECGNHMQTCRMQIGGLCLEMDEEPFAFSALPYSAMELEQATHQEELPAPNRTYLTVAARMRGVGGIDSWGADVEAAYHIPAEEDIKFSFYVTPDAFTDHDK